MKTSRIKLILTTITVIFISTVSSAHAEKFLVVSDLNHPYHQQLVEKLDEKLSLHEHQIINISSDELFEQNLSEISSIITVGYTAASTVMQAEYNKPVLSLLIPRLTFNLLLNKISDKNKRYLYSSIYIDQPVDRQIRLIKSISPGFRKIGVLYGKNSYSRKQEITQQVTGSGLEINNITVLERTELISETRHLTQNSDLLLAIPDKTIYNRRSIKGILLTTYRNRIPVIGYSSAYVKAGALAAVYSSPENISEQSAEIILKHSSHSYISATRQHPKYFEIAINNKVARSLGISTLNKNRLLNKLKLAEPETRRKPKLSGDKQSRG